MSLTKNPVTGGTHTAKWPVILSYVAGTVIALFTYLDPELSWTQTLPYIGTLWGIGTIGAGAMKIRNR